MMLNDRLTAVTFYVSISLHVLVIAGMGGHFKLPFALNNEIPETNIINMKAERPAVLPEIDVIGPVKKAENITGKQNAEKESELDTENITVQQVKEKQEIKTEDIAEEAMFRYQDSVKQKIESYRRYPILARQRQIEGVVNLKFNIFRNGQTRNIEIVNSSGKTMLDRESLNTIKRATPFRPIPDEIPHAFITIYVSLVFSLD